MEDLSVTAYDCTAHEISRTIGPYLRDLVHYRGEPRNGLRLSLTSNAAIELRLSEVDRTHPLKWTPTFLKVTMADRGFGFLEATKFLYPHMPGLRVLNLNAVHLTSVFPMQDPNRPLVDEGIPPSLQYLSLEWLPLNDYDWSPLTAFLSRRVSSRNPIFSLTIINSPHMCRGVVERIRGMVREVGIYQKDPRCPFGRC